MEVDSADEQNEEGRGPGGQAQSQLSRSNNSGATFNTLSSLGSLRPGIMHKHELIISTGTFCLKLLNASTVFKTELFCKCYYYLAILSYIIYALICFFTLGEIPDAAFIHAARKRRQMARELGGEAPLVETETQKKRLVREDQDVSDDEDEEEKRIRFSGVKNKTQRQKIAEEIGIIRCHWLSTVLFTGPI